MFAGFSLLLNTLGKGKMMLKACRMHHHCLFIKRAFSWILFSSDRISKQMMEEKKENTRIVLLNEQNACNFFFFHIFRFYDYYQYRDLVGEIARMSSWMVACTQTFFHVRMVFLATNATICLLSPAPLPPVHIVGYMPALPLSGMC